MSRRPIVGLILAVLSLGFTIQAAGPPFRHVQVVAPSNAEHQVRAIVTRRFHASAAKRVAEIAPLYADDESLLVYRQGHVIRGWSAYKKYWESAIADLPLGFQVHFNDVSIQVGSNMAFAAAGWTTIYRDKDGKQVSAKGLMTLVLAEQPHGWHIIHEHISSTD